MPNDILNTNCGEYRFVYNFAYLKKRLGRIFFYQAFLLLIWALFFSVTPGLWDWIYTGRSLFSFILILFFLPFFLFPLSLFYHRRLRIVIGPNGISCSGFWLNQMPRHSTWDDFAQIRFTTVTTRAKGQLRIIVFTHKHGKQYQLFVSTQNDPVTTQQEFFYIGDGHTLTLSQAIETYSGPAVELSGEDKERSFAQFGVVELGKEVGHIAYAALVVAILAVILLYLPGRLVTLDSAFHKPFYWTVGICVVAAACWHMRRNKDKLLPAMLLAIVVVFMTTQILGYVSLWLGEKQQEPFRIVIENDEEQHWQSLSDPVVSILIRTQPEGRSFKGVGTERTLTLYRGPLHLNAIPNSEYKLFYGPPR